MSEETPKRCRNCVNFTAGRPKDAADWPKWYGHCVVWYRAMIRSHSYMVHANEIACDRWKER